MSVVSDIGSDESRVGRYEDARSDIEKQTR